MLEILSFVLGQVDTNSYLIADTATAEAAVIDPAWDGEEIAQAAAEHKWHIGQIWLTHAHFDHIAGITGLSMHIQPAPEITLHPDDLPLYRSRGAADLFGIHLGPLPPPTHLLSDGAEVALGKIKFEVRHTPGHSPGHVAYYCPSEGVMFCGDLIFAGSIGRDDLPGGDFQMLMQSIRNQVLNLPGSTRLLTGHGSETTVEDEKRFNPFLTGITFR